METKRTARAAQKANGFFVAIPLIKVLVTTHTATVIPIMIAFTGDVTEERKIVREVIHEWNDVNTNASQVVLSPIGLETHSSPELGG